jgi:hypothetical protein
VRIPELAQKKGNITVLPNKIKAIENPIKKVK